jgi:hypothetical protein
VPHSGNDIDSRWIERIHVEAHRARACFSLSWIAGSNPTTENADEYSIGRLVSAGGDGRICLWDVVSREYRHLQNHVLTSLDVNRPKEEGSRTRCRHLFKSSFWPSRNRLTRSMTSTRSQCFSPTPQSRCQTCCRVAEYAQQLATMAASKFGRYRTCTGDR